MAAPEGCNTSMMPDAARCSMPAACSPAALAGRCKLPPSGAALKWGHKQCCLLFAESSSLQHGACQGA